MSASATQGGHKELATEIIGTFKDAPKEFLSHLQAFRWSPDVWATAIWATCFSVRYGAYKPIHCDKRTGLVMCKSQS